LFFCIGVGVALRENTVGCHESCVLAMELAKPTCLRIMLGWDKNQKEDEENASSSSIASHTISKSQPR
jgi:hypothetical protein